MNGQHCENYDVKRETVHCYPRNVDRCFTWSLEFVSLDPVSGNIEILGKQNSLFPSRPVIKCLLCLGDWLWIILVLCCFFFYLFWLTDWLIDWLIDCLIDWLSEWVSEWVSEWLIDWLTDWLTDWLIDWLIPDGLIVYLFQQTPCSHIFTWPQCQSNVRAIQTAMKTRCVIFVMVTRSTSLLVILQTKLQLSPFQGKFDCD